MTRYEKFLRRPVYIVILVLLITFAGLWSLFRMPIDFFPGLNYPLLNIVTQSPGFSPEDIELLITRPVESEVQAIRGVRRTSSISANGRSQVTVEFSQGYDLLAARQLVSAAISRLTGQLPAGVHPIIDNLGSRLQQILGYTITDAGVSATLLRQVVQYRLLPALRSIPGISRVDVMGGKRAAYVVEPDLNKLCRLKISMTDLQSILKKHNLNVSGRYLNEHYLDIPIRGKGQVQNLDDLRFVMIKKQANGLPIFLKDIATVQAGALPEHYIIRDNQQPAVAILIQKENGVSTVDLAAAVAGKMQTLRALLPPGSKVSKFYDQSEILNESMHGVRNEIWMGAILAILVLTFFLRRLTPTLIVSVTIPLALFAAAMMMSLSGYTLNMMTLAALTLSVGMVVDDSIIVMENIERHREAGSPLLPAVLDGTRQILGADISGTVTTLIVFVPLLFLGGFVSQLIKPFGLTITYALLASLVLSLTVIPGLMFKYGGGVKAQRSQPAFLTRFIRLNDRWFQQIMRRRKRTFIFLTAAFLLIVAGTVTFNSAGFLPPIDEGAVLIEYVMRPGVSLHESYRMGERLTGEILQLPDVDNVYLKIGSPENTYYIEGANRGELRIKLKDKQRRQRSAKEVMELLRRKFSALEGVVFLFHQPTEEKIDESFSGLPAFFGISISGDNLDTLVALSQKVEDVASNNTGLTNIINTAKYTVPQIEVVPNRPVLGHYGLSVEQVLQQMSVAFRGDIISYFVKEQTPVAIFLRLPERQRTSMKDLRTLPIKTASGVYIPLQEVATIGYRNRPAEITHINSQREVTLMGELAGNPYTIVKNLQAKLRAVKFPAGYYYEIRGQYQTLMQSLKEMAAVIVAAILLVYLILYLQFNSFWQPFVILLKIPLDFMGAFLALLLTRQSLNIAVAIGLLTLVGVAVNNAIVLIDMVNQLRASRNLSSQEALLEAVHIRTRPILMTNLTTIFGLLPAAIGMGVGSRIHQPFAITLIGGLLVGTFFTLNIIPALYEKIGRWAKGG